MKEILDSLSTSVEKLYQGFVLRDLLGFVLPGSIFLLSIWSLFAPTESGDFCDSAELLKCFVKTIGGSWQTLHLVAFVGGSYLTALLLQSVHYGLVDLVYKIATRKRSYSGIRYYTKSISQPFNKSKDTPKLSEIPSLMSIGALSPEKALENLESERALSIFQESKAYSERISILQIVLGNAVLAGIPLLVLVSKSLDLGWWTILGAMVLLFGYIEHWRLFFVRNLRQEILIKVANAITEADIASGKSQKTQEPAG